jgi:hypothetical protein
MKPPQSFTHSQLIICEGIEERALVHAMIGQGLVPPMDVRAIGIPGPGGFGIDGLPAALKGFAGTTGFRDIQKVAIIFDNDENPPASFGKVRTAVLQANNDPLLKRKYSLPVVPWENAQNAAICVTALSLPNANGDGCLDSLVVDVLRRKYAPQFKCAEAAIRCAALVGWSKQKLDKALVRATLALVHKENPAATLTRIWEQSPSVIPPTEPEFAPLAAALSAL